MIVDESYYGLWTKLSGGVQLLKSKIGGWIGSKQCGDKNGKDKCERDKKMN